MVLTRPSPFAGRTLTSRQVFHSRPVSRIREPERDSSSGIRACARLAVVGQGRLGTALAAALTAAGCDVTGPLGRGFDGRCADGRGFDGHRTDGHRTDGHRTDGHRTEGHCADAVLLCVPDAEIEAAAALIAPGP